MRTTWEHLHSFSEQLANEKCIVVLTLFSSVDINLRVARYTSSAANVDSVQALRS